MNNDTTMNNEEPPSLLSSALVVARRCRGGTTPFWEGAPAPERAPFGRGRLRKTRGLGDRVFQESCVPVNARICAS